MISGSLCIPGQRMIRKIPINRRIPCPRITVQNRTLHRTLCTQAFPRKRQLLFRATLVLASLCRFQFPPLTLVFLLSGPETTPSMFYMLTLTSILLFVAVIILCLVIFAFGTLTGHCTLCCYSFTCIRLIRKNPSANQGKANSNNSTPNSSGEASHALSKQSKPATGGKTHKTKATKKSNKKWSSQARRNPRIKSYQWFSLFPFDQL